MPSPSLGWNQEPNTMLQTVALNSSSWKVIFAWGGGAYDTLRDRMLIWGGGHSDYGGNEIYAVNFGGTPSPQRLTDDTTGNCQGQTLPSCNGGVTPNSRHTYHCIEYLQNIDALWSWAGALYGAGYGFAGAWLWHCSTQQWQWLTHLQAGGTTNPAGTITDGSFYDTNTGYVWVWDGRSLAYWDPTNLANNWVMRYYNENGSANTDRGCIDTTRNRLYLMFGSQLCYMRLDLAVGVNPRVDLGVPSGNATWVTSGHNSMVYHAASDRIIVWGGGNTVYSYNPATHASEAITGYTGGPGAAQINGTYGRWNYSPAQGVFTLVNDFFQNAYSFRLGAAVPDTEAPTTPASPSATPISQSQINVSWTASTDNIAVTNYLIERCTGAACSSFVQVGMTSSTTFPNTGLTASTLYRYRVRATDAAGNLSGYSTTVEATTNAADVTAPTVPANLTPTVLSTSSIGLAWDASTDAVGVTGYRVERAQGAAGAFNQVSAPVSNAFTDTGLAQATLYRHRVRATDAAGNLSGYSNISSATTNASTIRNAGTGQAYSTLQAAINAASSGDIIEMSTGLYPNEVGSIPATVNGLTIRGIGGLAHLKWDTGDYRTATTDIPNGQGIIKAFANGNTLLENLELSGAKVADANGAGVRYGGAGNLTLRNVYAHDNQNGILGQGTTNNTLIIEFSRFETNGFFDGTFLAHNIYIGEMGTFIFRHSTSLDPTDGHCVKSRAYYNEILYNHISSKNSNGSYEIEFPNGHFALLKGNIIEQGSATDNSTIIAYGAEGLTTPNVDIRHEIYIVNNTIWSWRSPVGTFVQLTGTPSIYKYVNNARNSGGTLRTGTATSITETDVTLASNQFVDINNHDFHLVSGSTAINAGTAPGDTAGPAVYSLTPTFEYVATASRATRQVVGALDVGAHEFGTAAPGTTKAIAFSRKT